MGNPVQEMPFDLGNMIKGTITGGPYRMRHDDIYYDMPSVKMAAEIDLDTEIDIPTKDFNVPDVRTFKRGLMRGLMALMVHNELYVGCMGGIGRTGLYLAGLAKVKSEYNRLTKRHAQFDPVLYVRANFKSHAVETEQQEKYIEELDVADIARWFMDTQKLYNHIDSVFECATEQVADAIDTPVDDAAYVTWEAFDQYIENMDSAACMTAIRLAALENALESPTPEALLSRIRKFLRLS